MPPPKRTTSNAGRQLCIEDRLPRRYVDDGDGIAIGVECDRLSTRVAFWLNRSYGDTPRGQSRCRLFDVRHRKGDNAVPGVNYVPKDVEPTLLCDLPHHLRIVRDDIRRAIEESLIPSARGVEVAHRDTHEENVDVHCRKSVSLSAPIGSHERRVKVAVCHQFCDHRPLGN